MDAPWPVAGTVDQPLLKSADYLTARAHDFRVRIKAMMNPKGKKVTTVVAIELIRLRCYLHNVLVFFLLTERCRAPCKTNPCNHLCGQQLSPMAACHAKHTQGDVQSTGWKFSR